MRKVYVLWTVVLLFAVGCAASKVAVAPGGPGETPIWASEKERPKWTVEEPEVDGNTMLFVGLSGKYATEQEARDEAMRNATNNVIRYLGILAKDKYEKVATSFGLSSSVVDPTTSARQYEKQLAANVAKKLKAKKWYLEQWNTPTGTGWKAFVLSTIPIDSVNDSFKNTARDNMLDAQRKAKEAADEVAKKQAENAAKFWEDMTKQGVVEQ
jgi:hypothetical protein